jgi:glycosyltransferase involved in cell wall biosynthesis
MSSCNISVIVPTFNRAALLCETIGSVLPQLGGNDELIVVDDGSTDATRSEVACYGDRIRYTWQYNSYQPTARNSGMRNAQGKYLLFIDSDDLLMDSAISTLLATLEQSLGAPLAFGRAIGFCAHGLQELEELDDTGQQSQTLRLARANFIRTTGCVLIRKSAMDLVGSFDPRLRGIEDWDMWLRLSLLGRFARVECPVLKYRVHPGNMSTDRDVIRRSRNRFIIKHSSRHSALRADRESWNFLRRLRPRALHLELKDSINRYRAGGESIGNVIKLALSYGLTGQAARYAGWALKYRTLSN